MEEFARRPWIVIAWAILRVACSDEATGLASAAVASASEAASQVGSALADVAQGAADTAAGAAEAVAEQDTGDVFERSPGELGGVLQ